MTWRSTPCDLSVGSRLAALTVLARPAAAPDDPGRETVLTGALLRPPRPPSGAGGPYVHAEERS